MILSKLMCPNAILKKKKTEFDINVEFAPQSHMDLSSCIVNIVVAALMDLFVYFYFFIQCMVIWVVSSWNKVKS